MKDKIIIAAVIVVLAFPIWLSFKWHAAEKRAAYWYAVNANNVKAIDAAKDKVAQLQKQLTKLYADLTTANRETIKARLEVETIQLATGDDIAMLKEGVQTWEQKFNVLNGYYTDCGAKVGLLDVAWQTCANEVAIAAKVITTQGEQIDTLTNALDASRTAMIKCNVDLLKAISKSKRRLFPAVFGGYGVQGWTVGVGVAIPIVK